MGELKDSGYYGIDFNSTFRKIDQQIKRIEEKTQIDNYSLNTNVEIIFDVNYEYNLVKPFFKVSYSTAWHHKKYFDINRSINPPKYLTYNDNQIFSFALTDVYFNNIKDKSKVKAKIKRFIDKLIKSDIEKFYNDPKYTTIEKPKSFNYDSDKLEKQFKELV